MKGADMAYLSDYEKRILFSALAREKEVCKEIDKDSLSKEIPLTPIVESLERKFYYDRYEKEIRNKVIDDFAEEMKAKILEEIYDVSECQKLYEVGSDMSTSYSHIMGTLRDVYHRIVDEITEKMKGEQNG